jgi:hypothetical protein
MIGIRFTMCGLCRRSKAGASMRQAPSLRCMPIGIKGASDSDRGDYGCEGSTVEPGNHLSDLFQFRAQAVWNPLTVPAGEQLSPVGAPFYGCLMTEQRRSESITNPPLAAGGASTGAGAADRHRVLGISLSASTDAGEGLVGPRGRARRRRGGSRRSGISSTRLRPS